MSRFDAIVVGGGPAGLVAALGLADGGLRVAVVDPKAPAAPAEDAAFELRVSTLSPASIRVLDALGAWRQVPEARRFSFDAMAVWEDDPAEALSFRAADGGFDDLGCVVENARVRYALWAEAAERCELLESEVQALELDGSPRLLVGGERLRADFVVGADGSRSTVRAAAGIATREHDYFQQGLVAVVRTERPHGAVARQRFLPTGPLALLPLDAAHVSIVWTLPTSRAHYTAALDDERFAARLNEAAQGVLGRLAPVSPRATFPLFRRHAERYASGACALVGDAAHQIHPLAGQGANLGLLDAAALVECVLAGGAPEAALRRYARWRKSDAELVARGIHAIGEIYRWPDPAGALRRLGTRLVGAVPGLGGLFVRHAAGFGGRVPALARTVPEG